MRNPYDLVLALTSRDSTDSFRQTALRDFAQVMGWRPSDQLRLPDLNGFANAHLVVEHGLENTAVITFLRAPRRFSDLTADERQSLLNASYNNLVDWHIGVQADEATFVYNRSSRTGGVVEHHAVSPSQVDVLRSEAFEQLVGRRPSPNVPSLDDALIETISFWKRNLSAEMEYGVSNEALSSLFNAIIFTRAAEDLTRRLSPTTPDDLKLSHAWLEQPSVPLSEFIEARLAALVQDGIPDYLVSVQGLRTFDSLPRPTIAALLSDFCRNRFAPQFTYDFSIISKHALSRIYEHYVSALRLEDSPQTLLPIFRALPEEEREKAYGSVYTPQFIARFFSRYLREEMPPRLYRAARSIDPACGSGIFLRTLLEMQCDPFDDGVNSVTVDEAYANVAALDVDGNACQATRLSLALLHLVLVDRLPKKLNVEVAEAIDFHLKNPGRAQTFDVVVANPPYVALGAQSAEMRARVADYLGEHGTGRLDVYLAFLKLGLELLKPGGYGMFVIPHSFLLGQSASGMRELIAKKAWVRCLADLSAIRVFSDTGSYVILLIFQKRMDQPGKCPPATIVKCRDLAGRALQDAVECRRADNPSYSVYEVEQSFFSSREWLVLPPAESRISARMSLLRPLEDYMEVKQGFISGADDVFVIPAGRVPSGEEAVYAPFLQDRDMRPYTVPRDTSHVFFYPYLDGKKVDQATLASRFPKTWHYLLSHKQYLTSLRGENGRAWWEPLRPRMPKNMMRPKIVTPHLALVPRFAVDLDGILAVSHGPFLFPRKTIAEDDVLRFFVAVLNSSPCFWYISSHSHTYSRGYAMLECRTLRSVPVPDPSKVAMADRRQLLALVDQRLAASGPDVNNIEREIDQFVADLYGLSEAEYASIRPGC